MPRCFSYGGDPHHHLPAGDGADPRIVWPQLAEDVQDACHRLKIRYTDDPSWIMRPGQGEEGEGSASCYLQRVLGADGEDLVLEVAELTAPGPSLADPADEAGLVGVADRSVTAARAQQLPLTTQTYHQLQECLLIQAAQVSAHLALEADPALGLRMLLVLLVRDTASRPTCSLGSLSSNARLRGRGSSVMCASRCRSSGCFTVDQPLSEVLIPVVTRSMQPHAPEPANGAVQQVLFKLKVGGGGVEQPAAVQLALQVRLRLVFQHSPSGIQKELSHLLPTVHCQAGTGNSKLEQENDEKNHHDLVVVYRSDESNDSDEQQEHAHCDDPSYDVDARHQAEPLPPCCHPDQQQAHQLRRGEEVNQRQRAFSGTELIMKEQSAFLEQVKPPQTIFEKPLWAN
ncbi:hypothetical protein F7725_001104 [Dissostichus mawsoni]|uniref:Uncharacterized protein n=1 Tax=Dissostichus mawsoni TaxID=36200 RepID=A0A7J5ZKF5_DISMA|nr:hypothetical protein F7725_001104 [Dissostichus mawsoni]